MDRSFFLYSFVCPIDIETAIGCCFLYVAILQLFIIVRAHAHEHAYPRICYFISYFSHSSDISITSAPDKDERKPYIETFLYSIVTLCSILQRSGARSSVHFLPTMVHPPHGPPPPPSRSCVCRFCDLFDVWNVLIFNQRPLEGSLG